ncbi:MAG: hypothetical protein BRD42_09235 [Bacteroidetes bacterium QS_3_64_15]|nr:MAG: hypothetical protein BRD42_09235 [Bacteroidetes bacterium QS_3_64_15]
MHFPEGHTEVGTPFGGNRSFPFWVLQSTSRHDSVIRETQTPSRMRRIGILLLCILVHRFVPILRSLLRSQPL